MKSRFAVKAVWAAILLVSVLAAGASAQTLPVTSAAGKVCVAETALPQSDLLLPQPTLTCGLYCMPTQYTTVTISGSGSSCANAQASLDSQLQSIARNRCINDLVFLGSCSVVIHNTTACTLIGAGTYQIQGYATFHCKETNC